MIAIVAGGEAPRQTDPAMWFDRVGSGETADERYGLSSSHGGRRRIDVDQVIAADSGLDHLRRWGIRADVAVGDFDSVSAEGLEWARTSGTELLVHPQEKEETDLELALLIAMQQSPRRIVVAGISGGRPDHYLANLALLSHPRFARVAIDVVDAAARMWIIHGAVSRHEERPGPEAAPLDTLGAQAGECGGSASPPSLAEPRPLGLRSGDLLSLIPMHGTAYGVRTHGLRYRLDGDDLPAGSPRGVSNVCVGPDPTVELRSGTLLAVSPRAVEPHE